MSVITVDTLSRRPIYEQLVDSIKNCVLRGALKAGEQLPSVRALAGELAVNPNTVQKAYTELERLGIIFSASGKGSFISGNTDAITETHRREISENLAKAIREALDSGITKDEITELIDSAAKAEQT